jgi:phosphoribosyl 1,2-cyclic phosphodiesterase
MKPHVSVCVLASGSRGNCIHIASAGTAVLLDAGLSGKEIERRMRLRGLSPEHLAAIVVSHEHQDHILGVGVLSRRYHLPVFMTPGTAAAAEPQIRRIENPVSFVCGRHFRIGSLMFTPFSTCHDAKDPCAFTVQSDGIKIGIATDLGFATALVKEHLTECRLLILEANHDPEMLMNGPYPWPLKQRIHGRSGHLSNSDSARLLQEIRHPGLEHVILAHLSQTNNTPEKAACEIGNALGDNAVRLTVTTQDACSDIFRLGPCGRTASDRFQE